jgi:hypothetical protein
MAKSAFAAGGRGERRGGNPFDLYYRCYDELRYPHARGYGKGFSAEVDEEDADFSPVVGVNRAGAIEEGDAVVQGQAAARAHLGFVAFGQLNIQPCGNSLPLPRR